MTDAVHSEVETQRTFADDDAGGFLDRCGVAAANPLPNRRREGPR
jgi:hypothetical protein